MKIVASNGSIIHIPEDAYISLYNSPYPGHYMGTAVDVYYADEPLFPMEEGRVSEIRKIKTPAHIPVREDYLILVKSGGIFLKILHVFPTVKVGDNLVMGDPYGRMIKSGYFMPWSGRHVHYEIRPQGDRYRARGGLPLHLEEPVLVPSTPLKEVMEFEITEITPEYCWAQPLHTHGYSPTPLTMDNCAIDGGIPYYRHAGLLCNDKLNPSVRVIDTIDIRARNFRGIGTYIGKKYVKLLGLHGDEGEIVRVEFSQIHSI